MSKGGWTSLGTPLNGTVTTSTVSNFYVLKPQGRARHFDGLRRGLARRLRIPWVRRTLYEVANPQVRGAVSYGPMWLSTNALANCSFACTCHPNERYSRKSKKRHKR